MFADDVRARLEVDAQQIIARYPVPRSALLPMLHLVQSEQGYVSPDGIAFCADLLGLTAAEVSAVATFYTQYKRHPNGTYTVGVCTNTLCAVMGGDAIFARLQEYLGIGHDETTADGSITLERIECNAGCDYAPVMMVNWEFMDDMTPDKAVTLLDDLKAGQEVHSTRGATLTSWREAERVIAGFPDGRADEGPSAGAQSLLGLRIADEKGWAAPSDSRQSPKAVSAAPTEAPTEPAAQAQEAVAGVGETPEAKVPPKQRRKASKPGEETAK
jgi:NADH-quinone oxidoreductase subunit E